MAGWDRLAGVSLSVHHHILNSSVRVWHRPVPVRRRFRLDHASLEPGGSDSLGLKENLCGVVWRWLDQRVCEDADGCFLVCVCQSGMRLAANSRRH